MKVKFYLWTLLTLIATSFAASCSDDDEVSNSPIIEPPAPTMQLQLAVSDITAHEAQLQVTPTSNEGTYFADIAPAIELEGLSKDELILKIFRESAPEKARQGVANFKAEGLKEDTEYVFYGLVRAPMTPHLSQISFRTLKEEAPEPQPEELTAVNFLADEADGSALIEKQEGKNQGSGMLRFAVEPKSRLRELAKSWSQNFALTARYEGSDADIELPILKFTADKEAGTFEIKVSGQNLSQDFYLGNTKANATLLAHDGSKEVYSDAIALKPKYDSGENPDPRPDPQPEPDDGEITITPGVYFAKGVTRESGWYDVNKKGDGTTGNDATLCWGAACSNMLQWWQDQYVAAGNTLPASALTGEGKNYELAIFEAFRTEWVHDDGGQINYGIPWYFTGEYIGQNDMSGTKPKPGTGGYLKDIWSKVSPQMGSDYITMLENYYLWGPGSEKTPDEALRFVTEIIVKAFNEGMCGLSITVGSGALHAITLWGFEIGAEGIITKLYITDSDDLLHTPQAPRVQELKEYGLGYKQNTVGITGMYDGFNKISDIFPFRGCFKKL